MKLPIALLLSTVFMSSAYASNYHCVMLENNYGYIIDVYNDNRAHPTTVVIKGTLGRELKFSGPEVIENRPSRPNITAIRGSERLDIGYHWGEDPHSPTFSITVM